jgi:adenosylcobinamide-GDP ribazoletransferase
VSSLADAARYLTIIPVPGARANGLERVGRAAGWFPVVGLAIGVVLVVVEQVTSRLFPPLLAALLVVTVWKLVTGGLHLDGLADCLDGLHGRDPAHRLSIMRDSRIGAFGAIGLILFLFLEIATVAELTPPVRGAALLAAPAVARAMPPLVARLFSRARAEGHGAAFAGAVGRWSVPVALGVALGIAAIVLGWGGLGAVAVAALVAVAFAGFMARRLGGVTGDVLGAVVEGSELAVLLTVEAWAHGAR